MSHRHKWRFGYKSDENYNIPGSSTPGFYCTHEDCGFESDSWIFLPEVERRLNATECLSAEDAMVIGHGQKITMGEEDSYISKLYKYARALEGKQ